MSLTSVCSTDSEYLNTACFLAKSLNSTYYLDNANNDMHTFGNKFWRILYAYKLAESKESWSLILQGKAKRVIANHSQAKRLALK